MSNNTSTNSPSTSDPPASPTTSVLPETSSPTNPPTTAAPPDTSSSVPPTTLPPTTSEPPPTSTPPTTPPTTSNPPTTSTPPPTSSTPTTSSRSSTSTPPTSSSTTTSQPSQTTIIKTSVITPTTPGGASSTIYVTTTSTLEGSNTGTSSSSSSTNTSSSGAALDPAGSSSNGALSDSGRIAIAVVVPIVGVALLVAAGIFLWRRRKARKDLEEQRRKEVEDYAYNPNADPTIPGVAGAGAAAGAYEMREDGAAGYRGWGSTTLASSTGRKASTTMSGGAAGVAYSDATSPTHGNISDTRSGEPLMTMTDGSHSPEGEILGAMGPSSSNNRVTDVHRGPSNASSSYSAAARSDGSGDGGIGVAYGSGGPGFYDQYPANGNPYADGGAMPNRQGPAELGGGQPVIREVTARRNTRIENPAHYPQQSAGISQNF